MTRVLVTGGTGLIGRELVGRLRAAGDDVTVLSRDPERAEAALADTAPAGGPRRRGGQLEVVRWPEPTQAPPSAAAVIGADAVVNLLGEPLAQRWTAAAKRRIHDSRVLATRRLVAAIVELPAEQRPGVLVSQSATGFYGPRTDEELDERAGPGADFLAGVVADWEQEALAARSAGVRVVVARTGVVLSRGGGALAQMLPPFRLGLGGPVAGGAQWMSWISLADAAGALALLVSDERAAGPVNLTAPEPVRNREFAKALGRVLRRPAVMPLPAGVLRLRYGEMASVITTGQRVLPRALQELGYEFEDPRLEGALRRELGR